MEEYKWYILINGKNLGPFSSIEIAKNKKCDFKTPVWREGFEKWFLIEEIPELNELLKKVRKKAHWWEEENPFEFENPKKVNFQKIDKDEIAIDLMKDPFFFIIIFIILITSLILIYNINK